MKNLNLYGFSTSGRVNNSPIWDRIIAKLADFMLHSSAPQVNTEIQRRLALLTGISLIGTVVLALFGILAFVQGNAVLGTLDITLSVVLLANLYDARIRGKYSFNISIGISFTSLFYIYLYVNGGVNQTAYVWYYTYPLIAMFLLGSRSGAVATTLMTIPVMLLMVFKPDQLFFNQYHFDFEIRFLFSYMVVGTFSFLIENAAEKNRREIYDINKNLEKLVHNRTAELSEEVENHKKAQQLLQRSETRYRTMFEKSGSAVFLVDKNSGYYLDANPAAEKLTGRKKEELLTLTTSQITPESAQDRLAELSKSDSAMSMRYVKYMRPDGTSRDAILNAVSLGDNLVMGLAQDITELKKVEDERSKLQARLNHAQKMEAIGTMAGGVAHDLNNILAGIVSYPEMIRRQLPSDSPISDALQTIEEAGRRAATVVSDLLTLSRNAAAAKQPTDLNQLITDFIRSPEWHNIKKIHPNVALDFNLNAHSPIIQCSPVHMKKCMMNLLHNAFEATGHGGHVLLSTENTTAILDPHVSSSDTMPEQEIIRISICDNGPGIADEHLEHIFEPFYTTKKMGRSGTGLGLSVVWNTVTEHGGNIIVKNANPGALFEISLPLTTHDIVVQPMDLVSELDKYKGTGNILVIDDEVQLRHIAKGMVEMLGYSVTTVASGEEALDYLSNHTADLIFLDMILGEGMNGYQTYAEIIKHNPGQKAVIVSGYSTSEEVQKTLNLGASSIIRKPYSLEDIGLAIKECLQQEKTC